MENVLDNAPEQVKPRRSGPPISAVGIILTILLFVVLMFFGYKLFGDLNKSFNPHYDTCGNRYSGVRIYEEISYQVKAPTTVTTCDAAAYKLNEILLHAVLAVPLLLGAVLLYFYTHLKSEKSWGMITWAYFIMAIWFILHVLYEVGYFMVARYETWGMYVVLVPLVVVLTWLIIFIQKKVSQKREMDNR